MIVVNEGYGPSARNMVGEEACAPGVWVDEYPDVVGLLAEAGLWGSQPGCSWVPKWFEVALKAAQAHDRWLPTFPRKLASALRAFYAEAERRRKVPLERSFVRMVRDDVFVPLYVAHRWDGDYSGSLPELLLRGPGIRRAALAYAAAYRLGGVDAVYPLLAEAQEVRWANIRVKFKRTSKERRMGAEDWDQEYRLWLAASRVFPSDTVKRAFRAGWKRSVRAAQRRVQAQFYADKKAVPTAKREAPLLLRCGSCGADALAAEERAAWPNWLDVWDNLSQAQQAALVPAVFDRVPRPLDEAAREALGFWRKLVKFDPPAGGNRSDVVKNIYTIVALLNDPPAGLLGVPK